MTIFERDWRYKVLPSLKAFRQVYGHCYVPLTCKVPDCPPWPKAAAGMSLGMNVHNIRRNGSYAEQVARDASELKKLGFVWNHSLTKWNDLVFPALEVYSKKNGNCNVFRSFVVPSTDAWPERAHGFKLGVVVSKIRQFSYYFDSLARNVDRLADLGFEVRIATSKWDRRVELILATFEELHGHRNVPSEYVVPSEHPWEESDWGILLGKLRLKEAPDT